MASRTGLMPATVKIEGRPKLTSTISARKPLQNSKAVAMSVKTAAFSNIRRRTEYVKPLPTSKHELAAKKATVSVTSNIRKNVLTAGKKDISKPVLTAKINGNLRKSHPVFMPVERTLPKHTTPSRKSYAAGQPTPKSILKKEPGVPNSGKKSAPVVECSDSHHVKFKGKVIDQASMRAKLNAWLEAKGKVSSTNKYRHKFCFDGEVSAEKKKDVLVDRTVRQNLLSQQVKNPNDKTAKKQLFTGEHKSLPKTDKENAGQDVELCRDDTADSNDNAAKIVVKEAVDTEIEQNGGNSSLAQNVSSASENMLKNVELEAHNKMQAMLEECLHLFNAGCPLESILPWFKEMETSLPNVLTFATYYIYKAKVVAVFPQMVLDVFCEAVRNNAQPSELLATEIKSYFSKWLTPMNESNETEKLSEQMPSQSSGQDITGSESLHSMDIMQSTLSSSRCGTPKEVSNNRGPSACSVGSTVKYSISSTKHLMRRTPGSSTVAVVTPVRRSVRLSGKPPASGTRLRREVNSISDLSSTERQSMLFKINTALTDKLNNDEEACVDSIHVVVGIRILTRRVVEAFKNKKHQNLLSRAWSL